MSNDHRLFFYGTLRHPPLCERLLERSLATVPAIAPGYRAAPIIGQVYPGLLADPDGLAPGVVVTVSTVERLVLDRFEGDGYRRTPISVVIERDTQPSVVDAWLLLDTSSAAGGHWSFDNFLSGAAEGFVSGSIAGEVHPQRSRHG